MFSNSQDSILLHGALASALNFMNSNDPAPVSPSAIENKCQNFLSTLLRLAGVEPTKTASNVKKLIQNLIDGTIEPEEFSTQLQKELHSDHRPYLIHFLKKSLPQVRQALISGEMTIDGIRPPPVSSLQSVEPTTLNQSSKNNSHLDDREGVVEIVSSVIHKLTRDASKTKTEMEYLNMQSDLNQRLHSIVFYLALRSNNFICVEADKYYESFPQHYAMNWRFYLKLNFQCNWSVYFVECAKQLDPEILAFLIKNLLPLYKEEEDHLKYYTWHLALQTIIWKFGQFDDPSIMQPSELDPFHNPFTNCNMENNEVQQEMVFSENIPKSKLLHAFITILNHMIESPKISLDFLKVVVHFYKTTFKLITQIVPCRMATTKELFRMSVNLLPCSKDPALLAAAKMEAHKEYGTPFLNHAYLNESWEICPEFLFFLAVNYWKDAELMLSLDFTGCSEEIKMVIPRQDFDLLRTLFNVFSSEPDFQLLKAVVQLNYSFASRAAATFLLDRELRNESELINLLKKQATNLRVQELYQLLITTVVESDSAETKMIYLRLFFQMLSAGPVYIYNDALQYIFQCYGQIEHFKLPETDSRLLELERKTMLVDEAEKFLLPLFIQKPLTVLKTLIEQALLRGAEGIAIIPVLKFVPAVCHHNNSFPLIDELSHYFLKESLETCEEKHIVALVESLMEVQVKREILSFDLFLEQCILPCLLKNLRTNLTLECLNVSLKTLSKDADMNISDESFFPFMEYLTVSINDCIKSGNGKRKELLLHTLSLLGKSTLLLGKLLNASEDFIQRLFKLEKAVHVYLKPFFENETYKGYTIVSPELTSTLWIYCCHYENPEKEFKSRLDTLKKMYKYETLLSILEPSLFHFTMKEWTQSSLLLKAYFEYFSENNHCDSIPSLFPKSNPQLYVVIRTLMDCYKALLQRSVSDKQYVTNCFTNTVINILGQESHPHLLLNVFLDTCHLASNCEPEIIYLLSSFLIHLKKSISVNCGDTLSKSNYSKLMLIGVKCLPDSGEKTCFLQKF